MMKREEFKPRQISDLVMKINGEIEPVGETHTDDERYFNLLNLLEVMDILIDEIMYVYDCADSNDFSMKRSGDKAVEWFHNLYRWMKRNNYYDTTKENDKLSKIAELVEGDIGHFERDDAMDLLYDIKNVLKD